MKISFSLSAEKIINDEELILKELAVEKSLYCLTCDFEGLKRFAEAFHFVRYDFCHLNFIVGERCCDREFLWGGLAKNIYEELGGKNGQSHNQLYRDFLASIGAREDVFLEEPEFASQYNRALQTYCRQAPIPEALFAIAIYEAFDIPDYQLLLRVVKQAGVSQQGLRFFQVHAVANHFEMFEDVVTWLRQQEGGETAFHRAKEFVFKIQTKMWCGLIEHLQEQTTDCCV
ncbi:iron-containing redox enzyme family protein [Zarconia navalis]|uniref:iron-containing redox enzyme family protein n=1 Tax=Zarconia navalis TaxID=2992134 RepID=UPI0021F90823|nr:iron-containing redox enzyme family protein [Zarconia navalis]